MQVKLQFNFAERWQLQLSRLTEEKKKKNKLWAMGMAGVLTLGAVGSLPWAWEYKVSRDLVKVNEQIKEMKDVDAQVQRLNTLKAQVQNQKQILSFMAQSTRDPEPILDKVRSLLPAGALVNSFVLTADNTLNIRITVANPVDVASVWVSFRDSGMFKNVDMQTVSLEDKAQAINFILNLK